MCRCGRRRVRRTPRRQHSPRRSTAHSAVQPPPVAERSRATRPARDQRARWHDRSLFTPTKGATAAAQHGSESVQHGSSPVPGAWGSIDAGGRLSRHRLRCGVGPASAGMRWYGTARIRRRARRAVASLGHGPSKNRGARGHVPSRLADVRQRSGAATTGAGASLLGPTPHRAPRAPAPHRTSGQSPRDWLADFDRGATHGGTAPNRAAPGRPARQPNPAGIIALKARVERRTSSTPSHATPSERRYRVPVGSQAR